MGDALVSTRYHPGGRGPGQIGQDRGWVEDRTTAQMFHQNLKEFRQEGLEKGGCKGSV